MRFDVVTLFPELFAPHLALGVTRRAFETRQVDVRLWQLRDFADDPHRRVDDRPYGGGPGMVMLAEPLERAVAAIRSDRVESPPSPLILFSPAGRRLDQALVRELARGKGALLLCGRYEGVDQRFIDRNLIEAAAKHATISPPGWGSESGTPYFSSGAPTRSRGAAATNAAS